VSACLEVRSFAATYPDDFRLPEHDHGWGQLVYATRGVVHVESHRSVWIVASTRGIWLPPGRPHALRMQGTVALRTLYLAPRLAARIDGPARSLEVSPLLRELVLHILERGMLEADVEVDARLARVLVDQIAAAPPHELRLPMPRDARARSAAERIRADPGVARDLGRLARDSGASVRTLQRLFVRETGLSITSWCQKLRLLMGMARLGNGACVGEAAHASGYASASAFSAAFRRHFGVTPRRFLRTP